MTSRVRLLGVHVDASTWEKVRAQCAAWLHGDRLRHLVTANPEIVLGAAANAKDRTILRRAALVLPDGVGVSLAAGLIFGVRLPRFAGVDLLVELCRIARREGKSVYLLGGTNGVAPASAERLRELVPGVSVASYDEEHRAGYPYGFSKKILRGPRAGETPASLWTTLSALRPSVFAVAYGAPAQERWIAAHAERLETMGVRIAVGVGGAFDILAGRLPRAPRWWRVLGGEWLWRLYLEPHRMPRVFRATVLFPLAVAREWWRGTPTDSRSES